MLYVSFCHHYTANVSIHSYLGTSPEETLQVKHQTSFHSCLQPWKTTPMLALILLLFLSPLLFAIKCGFLPGVGAGDNGRLPRATAIAALTVPFTDYVSLNGLTGWYYGWGLAG